MRSCRSGELLCTDPHGPKIADWGAAMSGVVRRYREVIAPARGPVLGYLASGISVSLKPLAAVFLLREAGRAYDVIGFVLAAEVLGAALGILLQGRLIDRHGPRRVLLPLVVVHVAALIVFVVAVRADWSVAAILGVTALWGTTQPTLLPTLRALWGTLFSHEQRETAYATQAILTELVFVLGPLVASGVALAASPTAAMLLAAALSGAGVTLFALTTTRRPVTAEQAALARGGGRFAALRSRPLRVLVAIGTLSGVTGGAIEILLPVFAENSGLTERAGIGFALMAAGSIAGGLLYGSRRWGGTLVSRFALFTVAFGLLLLPLVATPAFAIVCAVLFVGGLTVAPAEACFYALIDDAADDATVVEANSWITAMYTAGLGAGTVSGGYLVHHESAGVAAVIPAVATLLAALVIVVLVRDAGRRDERSGEHDPAQPLLAT